MRSGGTQRDQESRWFGFEEVTPDEKTSRVRGVFDSVASRYDLMNDLMSGGLHRLWKDALLQDLAPRSGELVVDVAGGTGDIARRVLETTQGGGRVLVCDLTESMVRQGREKTLDRGWLEEDGPLWTVGNAESLPLPANTADAVTIAFGLRNVTHMDQALEEFVRVLKPGGRFLCLEFSPGVSPLLRAAHKRYCFTVLPLLGRWVARDAPSYAYLAESIQQFPAQADLAQRLESAGLREVCWRDLMGGLAVIHGGRKPSGTSPL